MCQPHCGGVWPCFAYAVDDGVEHRSGDHIQHRKNPVSQARVCRAGKDAAEDWSDVENADHGDVSATGRKGFSSALGRVNPENRSDNMYIGDHNQGTRCKSHQKTEEQGKFIGPRGGARESEQWREVTKEVGDKAGSTALEESCKNGVGECIGQSKQAGD